jgi:Protein of unknown function (DUF3309)
VSRQIGRLPPLFGKLRRPAILAQSLRSLSLDRDDISHYWLFGSLLDREGKYAEDRPIHFVKVEISMISTILLILLILLLLGALPTWPHSRNWGYGPSGGLGTILIIVLIIVLLRGGF